jgi:peptidoglycan/LPS O-acetylase OafA/YrhL
MVQLAHYKLLDGVRGVAAQPVLLGHSFALVFVGAQGNTPTVLGWLARLAVIIFFVLSGFVISAGIAGEIRQTGKFDWIEYAIRRAARIYPPYLAAIIFVELLALFVGLPNRDLRVDAWACLRALSFTFAGNDAVTIAPIWSLRLEVGLYVLAAMTALTFLANGRVRILLYIFTAALFSAYCWRLAFGGLAFALFAAGGLAAVFFDRLINIKPLWISVAVVSALALPVAWPTLIDDSAVSMIYQSSLGVPLALGLVALAHVTTSSRSRIFRLVLASGGWSYTLYVIHIPIVIALTTAIPFGPGLAQQVGMLLMCLLGANLVAVAVARVVERPKFFASLIRRALMRGKISPTKPARFPSYSRTRTRPEG